MTLKLKLFMVISIVIAALSGSTLGYLVGKLLFHVEVVLRQSIQVGDLFCV